jgi:hypothetical protein
MVVGKDGNYLITICKKPTGIYWSQRNYQHLTWLKGHQFIGLHDHPTLLRISIKSARKVGKTVSFLNYINCHCLSLKKCPSSLFYERTFVFSALRKETTCPPRDQPTAEKGN